MQEIRIQRQLPYGITPYQLNIEVNQSIEGVQTQIEWA